MRIKVVTRPAKATPAGRGRAKVLKAEDERRAKQLFKYFPAQDILICTGHSAPYATNSVYHHIRKSHPNETRISAAAIGLFAQLGRDARGPVPDGPPIAELGKPFPALQCPYCSHVYETETEVKTHLRSRHPTVDLAPGRDVLAQCMSGPRRPRIIFAVRADHCENQSSDKVAMEPTRSTDIAREETPDIAREETPRPELGRRESERWDQRLALADGRPSCCTLAAVA